MNGTVAAATIVRGGNRRGAVCLDIVDEAKVCRALFLRFDTTPAVGADSYTLAREAGVYRALSSGPVPIPTLRAVHPAGLAILMDRVSGQSEFHLSAPSTQGQIAEDLMRALAALHGLDIRDLDAPELGGSLTITEAVSEELRIWDAMYRETDRDDPLIEAALVWLGAALPDDHSAASLVHGDAGPGNFMFEAGRVTALIDWELAHLGDPVEDIAWLSMRSVFEPFPDFGGQVRFYESITGRSVDRDRYHYHQIFVATRIAIIRHRGLANPGLSDQANSLISRTTSRRLLSKALAQALDTDLPAIEPPPGAEPTELSVYYDFILSELKALALRLDDREAVKGIKSIARIAKLVRSHDAIGAQLLTSQTEDLSRTLGNPCVSASEGQAELSRRIRDRTTRLDAVIPYLVRQSARETRLAASALGAISERTFPSLT